MFKKSIIWLTPLLHLGHKRRLEENDMYSILPEDQCEILGEKLQRFWHYEFIKATKELRRPKLSIVLIKCFGKSFALAGFFTFSLEAIKVVQPLLLREIIMYFENYDPKDKRGLFMAYGYAAVMSLSTFGLTILQHLYYYNVQRIGMKIRVAMCHMIYKKITLNLHYLWLGPVQTIVIITLLWFEVGPSCLAGMAVIVLMMPVQTWFGKLFGMFRSKTAVLTDNRIRIMNEVVSGIRIIKMYAWEKPFSALVTDVRRGENYFRFKVTKLTLLYMLSSISRKEIYEILKSSYLRGLNMASFFASSKIIVFVTFTVYALLGNTITASSVFVTVSLYGTIKITVTLFFPLAIETLSETAISIRRIKNFLLLEEVERQSFGLPLEEKNENCIEIERLTCYWDKTLDAPSLQNISLTVKSHQLLTVVGPVGAGKSSLLSAILGELPHDTGTLKVRGQLTYAAQQPWVFPGTLRSNILFGREMDTQKYESVITACALKKDLELLPDGDLTLIGDRGATLSGGQKARVNLARAVYQDADVYLLDDPLSAVDTEVGKHLFEQRVIQKERTVISVTVCTSQGYIKAQGTCSELQSSGLDITCLLKTNEEQERWAQSVDPEMLSVHSQKTNCTHSSLYSHSSLLPQESNGNEQLPITYILQDWWLIYWARDFNSTADAISIKNGINATRSDKGFNLTFYLNIYSGLTVAAVVFGYARSLVTFHGLVRSAQTLHNNMFSSVIRSPVYFFDVNPTGRILNRFSKDIGLMDSTLPVTIVDFYQLFLQNIGVVAVAAAVMPPILIPVAPLVFIFLYLRRFYLSTSREVKRLESTRLQAGEVGLVLTYALTLVGNFQWTMRQSAEVENMMTSVERVVEYVELESEAPWQTEKRPPPSWPSKGLVTFDHVNFSYSKDGPLVLKDINAVFKPSEKVGVVGRTGAGKSSLVSALFRLAEPQGKIYIDGVLTSEIGLHDLRRKMSIIPQVQLKSVVEELPGKLETVLAESGSNFSVGQRQLVCLARAVLRKNRILIIDEATANVDPRTDELIQKTIRDKFRECTVLTIAHRLNTIIDSDRILVLDSGVIQELDSPSTLLQNKEGALYKMVQQMGQAEAAALLMSARKPIEATLRPLKILSSVSSSATEWMRALCLGPECFQQRQEGRSTSPGTLWGLLAKQ
ncbi:hypothetical protein L3Q82_000804 [Scortum barcoo]|uniref:Uncharacterized protein n=1 Tax=Scortum barcoo TaxID=214431 RepID=A0ACB8WDQ7_9TELE|nr:hypothetical protein L3Q82_000804 [Scortum barcoo]